QEITATVQLVTSKRTETEIAELTSAASAQVLEEPESILSYTNLRIKVHPNRLTQIARKANVVWIEPWSEPQLLDERQGLIMSSNYSAGTQLSRPGYLGWLRTKGLASTPDFIVDVSDSGIDQGSLDPQVIHRDFLGTAGGSRVA